MLIGMNLDEGIGFGMGRGLNGGFINIDEEFVVVLLEVLMNENIENIVEEFVVEFMELYLND